MQKSKAKKEKNNNNRQLLPWNLSVFNSPQLSVRFNVQDGGIALFLLKKSIIVRAAKYAFAG